MDQKYRKRQKLYRTICKALLTKKERSSGFIGRKNSNKELWSRTGQEYIPTEIARRNWSCIGHTVQKRATDTMKQALN